MSHHDVQEGAHLLLAELERAIVGKRGLLELITTAVLADGHILLEDVPGVAKTAIARAVAEAAGLRFARVQFTPDLIPADITGSAVLASSDGDTRFRPGPIFANLVLGDEINRAPPKTQSALLEAMEERQVTTDAMSRPLPRPFIVIGTQNPIEQEGTYPLPEAQLDRFLMRTAVGYPGTEHEVDLIMRRAERGHDRVTLRPVLSAEDIANLQARVEDVHIAKPVARYVVDLVEATRHSPRTEAGASPRGSLALLKASRARAAMLGRTHVLPDDVKAVAIPCLAHRLLLLPDQWVRGVRAEQVVTEVVSQVPAPAATDPHDHGPSATGAPVPVAGLPADYLGGQPPEGDTAVLARRPATGPVEGAPTAPPGPGPRSNGTARPPTQAPAPGPGPGGPAAAPSPSDAARSTPTPAPSDAARSTPPPAPSDAAPGPSPTPGRPPTGTSPDRSEPESGAGSPSTPGSPGVPRS